MLEYAGSQRRGLQAKRDDGIALVAVLRSLDWVLVAGIAGLVAVGLWGIAGVTRFDVQGNPNYYVNRQIVYVGVGVIALVAATLVDPDLYRRYWRVIFGGTVGLIAVVFLLGRAARGSTRWIDVGFFTFQPSEFGKLLFVLALAGFLAERAQSESRLMTTLRTLGLGLVPVVLVFAQPDLGTALVYLAALGAMLFVCGTPWRQLTALGAVAVLLVVGVLWAGPAVGVDFLKGYQKSRLTCFVAPADSAPVDARYNLEQSIAAVGSGQVNGRGVKNATQTRLNFLPEHGTDFVFASYSEQRGFVGASLLLALYLLVLWRGLRIVTVARDLYSADGRRRDPRRIALPDLRERGHDDGDRTDHRHPAAVRQRRRLVDDREPRRDGRAARRPRARACGARSTPALMAAADRSRGAARAAEGGVGSPTPETLVVGGAGELAAVLAKELGRGARAGAVRADGDPRGGAVLVWVFGRAPESADEEALEACAPRTRADRRRGGRSGLCRRARSRSCSPRMSSAFRPGEGFPLEAIGRTVAAVLGEQGAPLAARVPFLRRAVDGSARRVVRAEERRRRGRRVRAGRRPARARVEPAAAGAAARAGVRLADRPRERAPEILATLGSRLRAAGASRGSCSTSCRSRAGRSREPLPMRARARSARPRSAGSRRRPPGRRCR